MTILVHDQEIRLWTHSESGELEPKDEDGLEGKVPWDVVEDDAEGHGFQEVEETENDPVGEPLNIILVTCGFKSFEREERREGPTDKVGDWCGKGVDAVEESEQCDSTENKVRLGHLGALLDVVQHGIFGQLGGVKNCPKTE